MSFRRNLLRSAGLSLILASCSGDGTNGTNGPNGPVAGAGSNPIMFVTQVPVSGFTTRSSTFANHLPGVTWVPRGGDLMIRYPDGTLRNLTQEAGFGSPDQQGANAIAVREPSVHWSGTKALFSMVVGGASKQYEVVPSNWQIYEVTGLMQGETAQIRKIPNQPATYNNISPFYGTDERVLFTSDMPRTGQAHLYPQLDEYESAPTVTGIWSLDPGTGDLKILNHAVSGAFSPFIDSFGRVIFTRWDHLQQDQQADADRAGGGTYGSFDYADETAAAARGAAQPEVFPEPRAPTANTSGHTFNLFFPWEMNEDGTEEETVNHVGRHEFSGGYLPPSFTDDPSLTYSGNMNYYANRTFVRVDGGIFHMSEDPKNPGIYYGTYAREFGTNSANQILKFTGAPSMTPEAMAITAVTHPDTASFTDEGKTPAPNHSGMYRNPLPMQDGSLVVVHTSETRLEKNEGTSTRPSYRYHFRLKTVKASGDYSLAGEPLTSGISKTIWWWNPDTRMDFDGKLWELDPVEVAPRSKPARRTSVLEDPERQVLQEESVNEAQLRGWLAANKLALIVTRDQTSRDRGDTQQPFNLRVPGGGVMTTGNNGKLYDVAHFQIFQADQIRGYGGTANPRPGRRYLARPLHDSKAQNLSNVGGPAGSVKIALDGSTAAFVPANRALTWQLVSPTGQAVVRERNWLTFQPGEIRTCANCHGVNTKDQAGRPVPTNKPEALRQLLQYWKTLPM